MRHINVLAGLDQPHILVRYKTMCVFSPHRKRKKHTQNKKLGMWPASGTLMEMSCLKQTMLGSLVALAEEATSQGFPQASMCPGDPGGERWKLPLPFARRNASSPSPLRELPHLHPPSRLPKCEDRPWHWTLISESLALLKEHIIATAHGYK